MRFAAHVFVQLAAHLFVRIPLGSFVRLLPHVFVRRLLDALCPCPTPSAPIGLLRFPSNLLLALLPDCCVLLSSLFVRRLRLPSDACGSRRTPAAPAEPCRCAPTGLLCAPVEPVRSTPSAPVGRLRLPPNRAVALLPDSFGSSRACSFDSCGSRRTPAAPVEPGRWLLPNSFGSDRIEGIRSSPVFCARYGWQPLHHTPPRPHHASHRHPHRGLPPRGAPACNPTGGERW